MSVLVLLLAPRPRLGPRAASGADAGLRAPAEFDHVLSKDGSQAHSHGRCAAALLPKADTVVAVMPATELAWHRLTLPKAPPGKLRAALAGLLEDALLEDSEDVHFAVSPQAQPGQDGWVAVTQRAWLRLQLETLEAAGVVVDRVVPQAEPSDPPRGHFEHDAAAEDSRALRLVWARPDGVMVLHPGGTLARTWLPQPPPADIRWTAEPGAAEAAEHWLGQPVVVLPRADIALRAIDSAWNLRQFDFALRHRGVRALRDTLRQLGGAQWRPMRWGLVGLLLVNLLGLNAWAWHQRSLVEQRRQEQLTILKQAFPHINAVLDAPVQMQREAEQLRAKAGRPGDTDLEPMLQAAASAWPADKVLQRLGFENGQLTLSVEGWRDDEIEALRSQLEPAGWSVKRDGSNVTLRRATAGGAA